MRDSNVINEETNGLDMLLPAVLRQQTAQKIQKKKKRKRYYYKCFPTLLAGVPA